MFQNLRPTEIIVIALLVILLFGAKKLPELAKGVGQSLRIFKSEVRDPGAEISKDENLVDETSKENAS